MPPYARWERAAAHTVHILLYVVMFGMPLSGWIMDSAWKDAATHPMHWFGVVEWPRIGWISALDPVVKERWHDRFGWVHDRLAWVLYAAVALHVAGALKHQWVDRRAELQRMLPLLDR